MRIAFVRYCKDRKIFNQLKNLQAEGIATNCDWRMFCYKVERIAKKNTQAHIIP